MWIHLNDEDSRPLYIQVKDQIMKAILNRTLEAGTELPSIRKLAKEAKTSVITVKRAYQELENEGYIYTRAGKGTFVKELDSSNIHEKNKQKFIDKANELFEFGRTFNLSEEEMKELINKVLKERD
ncbi:GntR family transcriptional regulator [Bacillus shivajii]|uniref:GntR family transcriptional regulator n=1 Tax=Bacillus shivajii TaxID=1983719 RepID=UPI001CFC0B63|nr:GntR family transcriptional regulator [Bacillus shivajii]UCZ54395.1 GntR family transcriptional regulator [Bacillus shivajii]